LKKSLTVLALVAAFLLPSMPALAGSTGFAAEPGTPTGQIDKGRSRFTFQLQPGESGQDQIYVMNMGSQPILLTLYSADARSLVDGTFDVDTLDQAPKDVGSWVKFANGATSTTIALKNQQSMVVPFTVTIPANAQPGDHVGGIAVQSGGLGAGQIKVAQRIVTRLYARVPGALTPQLTVSNLTTSYTPSINPFAGTVNMSFTISNPGNVSLSADVTTSASTVFGIPVGSEATSQVSEMTPGTTRAYSVTVPNVGQWVMLNPKVVLVPRVDKDALNPGAMSVVTRDTQMWVVPYTWLVLLVLIAAVISGIRSRRASSRRQVASWLEFTEAEAKQKAEQK